jgi:hypothetical protein
MSHLKLRLATILLALALTAVFNSPSSAAGVSGSDQVVAWLRYDLAEANNAQNFALWIDPATPQPSSWAARSVGYLGAFVGSDYSKFIQVGYQIDPTGVQWFAESDTPGIVCDRGHGYTTRNGGAGCNGNYNDYASLDQFHMIQLDTNLNGTWQVFVYNAQGQGVQVAHKYFGTNTLYRMYTSSEESYQDQPSDPFIMVRYFHFHPKYYKYGAGWTDWPCSIQRCQPATPNYLNQAVCPPGWPYAAVINLTGDPRSWFAGWLTGGSVCNPPPPLF